MVTVTKSLLEYVAFWVILGTVALLVSVISSNGVKYILNDYICVPITNSYNSNIDKNSFQNISSNYEPFYEDNQLEYI